MNNLKLSTQAKAFFVCFVLAIAASAIMWGCSNKDQNSTNSNSTKETNTNMTEAPKGSEEKLLSSGKKLQLDTALSKEVREKMVEIRDNSLRALVNCQPFPSPIAFSVSGTGHHTGGQDVVLDYSEIITNEPTPGPWTVPNTFVAPCDGLYYFTVSFVKDAYYYGGTEDDVQVYLKIMFPNGSIKNLSEAWSGEGAGRRGTGAYSVTIRLNRGSLVQTYVHSDGGLTRHLARFHFTGFRIAP
jgi:C1q-related factor